MRLADLAILAAALALEVLFIGKFWSGRSAGETVTITSPAGIEQRSLENDQTLVVHGALGPSTLQIVDGAIRFVESPCRGKICIRSGLHRHAGATTACVPNRISLSVDGPREDGFDAIHH